MPTKLDLLQTYAEKYDVDIELVLKVFELERARLHPGKAEEDLRREEIRDILAKWIEENPRR